MFGVLVNSLAILVGGSIGLAVKKGIPERFSKVIMVGLGLCIIYIGISGSLQGENLLVFVLSMVLGVTIGTALRLDERLTALGKMIEKRISSKKVDASNAVIEQTSKSDGESNDEADNENALNAKPSFTKGFVNASILFCVGAMAIIGSFESGLTGDHSILYTKSLLDFIAALILTVSLGFGVIFSAIAVLIYQGLLVLLAQLLRPLLYDPVILAEIGRTGSVIIIALGLNMLGITKIKIADFLPAIILAPLLSMIAERI